MKIRELNKGDRFNFTEGGCTYEMLPSHHGQRRYQLVDRTGTLVPGMTYQTDQPDETVRNPTL